MMGERLQQIAEKALTDSVVRLVWQDTDENADAFVAKGTGFFIDSDLIVTNLHGVAGAPAIVAERVRTETQFPVEGVVASDIANDLIILKVTGEGVPLSLGDSDAVQIGDTVCTAGYPHGEKGVVTQVLIHGIRARDKHFEIQAAFDPGQSGSPLLNRAGEVIGVAVATFRAISFAASGAQPSLALSYAIPASTLAAMLADAAEAEPLAEWQKQPRIRGYAEGLKGQMQMMQQKYETAIACFDAALELNPDLVEVYLNRASVKMFLGKAEEAIADCDSALELNPDLFPVYVTRASANLLVNQIDAVIADCNAVLALNPDFFYAYAIRAAAKFNSKQYTAALADYDLALERNPDAVQIYFGRVDPKLALKDYTGAIEDFDKIISLSPEFTASFNIYTRRADAKYRLKDYKGTIEDYDKVIELNQEDSKAHTNHGRLTRLINAYTNRGRVKRLIGDYEGAIADCGQAIQLNSEQHAAYYNRAFAKRLLGKSKTRPERIILYQEAVDDYTEAIKLKPKHASSYHNRGFAKYQLGRSHADNDDNTAAHQYYQGAIDDYTEAIKINPEYLSAYSNRGRAKAALGQHEAAEADLAKAKELDPDVENKPD